MPTYTSKVELVTETRADIWLSETAKILSRSQIKSRLESLLINGKKAKLSSKLKNGDNIACTYKDEPIQDVIAEDLPLEIIYEDTNVIVVNKKQGMVTHPAHGHWTGTLVNALLFRFKEAKNIFGTSVRPGIVHRLDMDTSGIVICAKNVATQEFLAYQFKERTTHKEYLAIVKGCPRLKEGRITTQHGRDPKNRKKFATLESGGKIAITDYKVIKEWNGYSLVLLKLKTGRTHQLRVHMLYLKTPILGDPLYGNKDKHFPNASLMLHAWRLKIQVPGIEKALSVRAPIPLRFKNFAQAIKRRK